MIDRRDSATHIKTVKVRNTGALTQCCEYMSELPVNSSNTWTEHHLIILLQLKLKQKKIDNLASNNDRQCELYKQTTRTPVPGPSKGNEGVKVS
jgi:hypothetical protein